MEGTSFDWNAAVQAVMGVVSLATAILAWRASKNTAKTAADVVVMQGEARETSAIASASRSALHAEMRANTRDTADSADVIRTMRQDVAETKVNMATVEKATNSMKDALVAATAKAEHAAGVVAGRTEEKAEEKARIEKGQT